MSRGHSVAWALHLSICSFWPSDVPQLTHWRHWMQIYAARRYWVFRPYGFWQQSVCLFPWHQWYNHHSLQTAQKQIITIVSRQPPVTQKEKTPLLRSVFICTQVSAQVAVDLPTEDAKADADGVNQNAVRKRRSCISAAQRPGGRWFLLRQIFSIRKHDEFFLVVSCFSMLPSLFFMWFV